jgi:prenyltransferase beta subunit
MWRLLILLLLVPSLFAQSPQEDEQLRKFLAQINLPEGGYLPAPPEPQKEMRIVPTLPTTASGLRAQKYFSGKIPNIEKHREFVKQCFDASSGGFSVVPKQKTDVTTTAIGLMALAELEIDGKEIIDPAVRYLVENAKTFEERRIAAGGFEAVKIIPPVVKEWMVELRKTAQPDGTYGEGPSKGRTTGGAIAFILRLGGELSPEERKAVIECLQAEQQADGAYLVADGKRTDLEATYRVMRALYLLQAKPRNLGALKIYLEKCRNPDGGFGRRPGEASSGSGCYYYASISKWIKHLESAK